MHVEQCAKNQAYSSEMNVNPGDITSIYKALCDCDSCKLLDAVLRIEAGQKALSLLPPAKREVLHCRLKTDLEVMRNLDPRDSGAAEVLSPGQYFEVLGNMPWPQALAMNIWLPEILDEEDRYFILGQVFSAITCGQLTRAIVDAA